ncbi:MAG: site-specific integrase [Clostridia bacterium]|nr:site-specific integrase [Clostridia bacterium]
MPAYKDKNGTWYVSVYFTNWKGENDRKLKRGFKTRRDAIAWETTFINKHTGDLTMTFAEFYDVYKSDLEIKLRESTWIMKANVIETKILPYFRLKRMCEIKVADVIAWQKELMCYRDENDQPYSPGYLKTIHNQLSAIFNHAVRYYDLPSNPAAKAGNMGREKHREMLFWTKAEYLKFSEAMMDKPVSFFAFEMLYWCGIRLGELLALTIGDFDFENQTVRINKSYQRIDGRDVITDPKTKKSIRTVTMPDFICDEMQRYFSGFYKPKKEDRIFLITKGYLHREMRRGCAETGVKKIRIHDLRHSHVSLLIDIGLPALAIADRVGHESIDITYRYAHLFPSKQTEIAQKLSLERE